MREFVNEFKKFVDELKKRVAEEFNGEVSENVVTKSNDTELIGLVCRPTGKNVGPTFYVNDLYDAYKTGEVADMQECVRIVLDMINRNSDFSTDFEIDRIMELEYVKDRIVPFVLEKERNKAFLKRNVYSTTKTDLVICYKVVVGEDDGLMSITMTNEMFKTYGITKAELKKIAFKNEAKRYEFKTMFDTFVEMMGEEAVEDMGMPMDSGMNVLSNKNKTFGAVEMFNPVAMKEVKKKTGKETFYILPSSVHEVLIITMEDVNPEELKNMVMEVNSTQVAPNERLSDSVYFYNGKSVEKVA